MQTIARFLLLAAASTVFSTAASLAQAKVQITVDLDAQTIHVEAKDKVYDWKVSSGATGYETPTGKFRVLWMDKNHHSDEYDGVPMPNAIFFAPGFAIHGTSKSPWGRPASHGCVRLPVAKSALLFALVKKEGADISITGASPKQADASGKITDTSKPREGAEEFTGVVAGDPVAGVVRPAAAGRGERRFGLFD